MKIKDCVVISGDILDKAINILHEHEYFILAKELEYNYKNLEPIVKDAWNQKDTTLFDYLNDTEI